MSDTSFHIETIYAADQDTSTGGGRLVVWGVISLIVAAVWLYIVLWPVWSWAQLPMMIGEGYAQMATGLAPVKPSGQGGLDQLSDLFGASRAKDQNGAGDDNRNKKESDATGVKKSAPPQKPTQGKSVNRTTATIAARLNWFAWIAAPTFVGLWIAMAGAGSFRSGVGVRWTGIIISIIALIATGAVVWHIEKTTLWLETILPEWTKPVMLGLGCLFAIGVGLALSRKALFLHRFGAVLIILSACLTVAAFWANARWGPSSPVELTFYARVFGQQSAFGWITLIVLRGLK